MYGKPAPELHKTTFTDDFWSIIGCRNAVAHGVLMGKTDEGRFAFLTVKTADTDIASAIQIVESYSTDDIKHLAAAALEAVPKMEEHLKLRALREERRTRPLSPHRKAQKNGKR